VADRDATSGRGVHVDVVDADGIVRDHAQLGVGRDQVGVHGVGEQREEPLAPRQALPQDLRARRTTAIPDLRVMRGA
jgi:hypothetical protein